MKGYLNRIDAGWAQFRAGDLDGLLSSLQATAVELISSRGTGHLPAGMEEMDFLLEACGVRIAGQYAGKPDGASGELVIVTRLFAEGGHTALIGDLVRACPGVTVRVCIPNPAPDHDTVPPSVLERTGLTENNVVHASGDSPTQRIQSAIENCLPDPPARIHLIHHPDDVESVVLAVALASLTGAGIWMFHHADYLPTVGLYLKKARIIELTERTSAFTRHGLGLPNHYLPLTCEDPPLLRKEFLKNGTVTTGMCVSAAKLFEQNSRGYDYVSVISLLLKHTTGKHIHIGKLSPLELDKIHNGLKSAGVDVHRFQAVGTCASLAHALDSLGVDVMLNSFPLAGARTSVECMASGVPMLWHGKYTGSSMRRSYMLYPGAITWFHPDDLVTTIRNIDAHWCVEQGKMAREHWERTHTPENWQRFFEDPERFEIQLNPQLCAAVVQTWQTDFFLSRQLDRSLGGEGLGYIPGLRDRVQILKDEIKELKTAQHRNSQALSRQRGELMRPWILRIARRLLRGRVQ